MSTLETLKAARKLIAISDRWYRAPLTSSRGTIGYGEKKRRCMGSAICDAGAPWPSREDVWNAIHSQIGTTEIAEWNFTHTHPEVLRAFNEAIAKLEAQQ